MKQAIFIIKVTFLKRLPHEIEAGCRWFECVDLYLKRYSWG
jgi:hypothetical protein